MDDLSTAELDRLDELRKRATPGKRNIVGLLDLVHIVADPQPHEHPLNDTWLFEMTQQDCTADAEYEAALDPATIGKLLAMARRGLELEAFSDAMHKASEDHRKAVKQFLNQDDY